MITSPVVDELRETLQGSRSAAAFVDQLGGRVHQLIANMVDGRVLPKPEADALRAALIEFVGAEALPMLGRRNPNDALLVLDKLKAYGFAQLEHERPRFERERASKYPPPEPVAWPELAALREAAERNPAACTVAQPVQTVYFAAELKGEGIRLPEELLPLYAACDGFDLSCAVATYLPVFSLLPGSAIDISEQEGRYPRRAVIFQGGDEVQFSVYRDGKKQWWLVFEHEFVPIAKKALDLRELIRFGIEQMNAPNVEATWEQLSWDRYFGIADRYSGTSEQ